MHPLRPVKTRESQAGECMISHKYSLRRSVIHHMSWIFYANITIVHIMTEEIVSGQQTLGIRALR